MVAPMYVAPPAKELPKEFISDPYCLGIYLSKNLSGIDNILDLPIRPLFINLEKPL